MTDTAIARKARNARTNREKAQLRKDHPPPGAISHKMRRNESLLIHCGVSRVVIVKACSHCGYRLQENKVECQTILTRFRCPQCGQSIVNSNENRCRVCFTLCADSETYNAHKWGGCPNAGTLYPFKGMLVYRDENPKEKVVV
jgi:predicted Zn-ribbon and HTH transcriptional regulator